MIRDEILGVTLFSKNELKGEFVFRIYIIIYPFLPMSYFSYFVYV